MRLELRTVLQAVEDALDVDGVALVHVRRLGLGYLPNGADACVAHERIDPPVLLADDVKACRHRVLVRHVAHVPARTRYVAAAVAAATACGCVPADRRR
eukprot:6171899-Pleurochrysis_carterae.AAC.2